MSRAALRVLNVLDALKHVGRPMTAAEVARATALPEATAWRMLQTLAEWGGVERQTDGAYRVATRLWAVGATAPCVRRLQKSTRHLLAALADQTSTQAALAVFDGAHAAVVVATSGGRLHEGDRVPLERGAMGRVFSAARGTAVARARLTDQEIVAAGLLDPGGAGVGVVTLTHGARVLGSSERALVNALPRIRANVYRDELIAEVDERDKARHT